MIAGIIAEHSVKPRPDEWETELYAIAVQQLKPFGVSVAVGATALAAIAKAWGVSLSPTEAAQMMKPPLGPEMDEVPPVAPKPKAKDADSPDGSEAAIAEYLATQTELCDKLKWCPTGVCTGWFEWSGKHWAQSPDKIPLSLQVAVRHAIATGLNGRSIELKNTTRLESASSVRGIGTLLSAWPRMQLASELDPPGFISMPSCCMNLHTGERFPHNPELPITRLCPVDPGPGCELWLLVDQHLKACLGSYYTAVKRFLGSSLLGRGADRKLLWLCGPGGDGKSTLAKLLRAALGDHAAVIPAEFFADGSRNAHVHELGSGVAGTRLGLALEVGTRLDWDKLKGLSGGDEQETKRLHGRRFSYSRPPCLVLISNSEPLPPDRACAERILLAKMLPPDEPDERLMTALKDGGPDRDRLASACLGWLFEGCREYLLDGLGPLPSAVPLSPGLELWWVSGVSSGRVLPRKGWSSLADLLPSITKHFTTSAEPVPHSREIAAFLKSKVQGKRFEDGRRYFLTRADA